MTPLRDDRGHEIKAGDVLRVLHYIGARRKRHYMYKQAVEYKTLPSGGACLKISHLNRVDGEAWEIGKNYYVEIADGRTLAGVEIVQSD